MCQRREIAERKNVHPSQGSCREEGRIIINSPNTRGAVPTTSHLNPRFMACNSADSCYNGMAPCCRQEPGSSCTLIRLPISGHAPSPLVSHHEPSQAWESRGQGSSGAAHESRAPGSGDSDLSYSFSRSQSQHLEGDLDPHSLVNQAWDEQWLLLIASRSGGHGEVSYRPGFTQQS